MQETVKIKKKKGFKRPSRDSYVITLMTAIVLVTLSLIPFCLIFFPANKEIIETIISFLEKEVLALFTLSGSIINSNFSKSKLKKKSTMKNQGEEKNENLGTPKTGDNSLVSPSEAVAAFDAEKARLTSKAQEVGLMNVPKVKYDIKNLKDICLYTLKVTGGVQGVFADGKVTVPEGVAFLFANLGNIEAIRNIDFKLLPKEALDLDESEITELATFLNTQMRYENVFDSEMVLGLVDATIKALGYLVICGEKFHEALGKHRQSVISK